MSTLMYILTGWILFIIIVYAHLFWDMKKQDIRQKWTKVFDAFTEEE